jgi:hypothetical protein
MTQMETKDRGSGRNKRWSDRTVRANGNTKHGKSSEDESRCAEELKLFYMTVISDDSIGTGAEQARFAPLGLSFLAPLVHGRHPGASMAN